MSEPTLEKLLQYCFLNFKSLCIKICTKTFVQTLSARMLPVCRRGRNSAIGIFVDRKHEKILRIFVLFSIIGNIKLNMML